MRVSMAASGRASRRVGPVVDQAAHELIGELRAERSGMNRALGSVPTGNPVDRTEDGSCSSDVQKSTMTTLRPATSGSSVSDTSAGY